MGLKRMNIQETRDMINQWAGQDVLLIKEEDGDVDKTVISLKDVTFSQRGATIDDYVSPDTLQLHGEGYVLLEDQNVPLPNDSFDIALSDDMAIRSENGTLEIRTDRAAFTVMSQSRG